MRFCRTPSGVLAPDRRLETRSRVLDGIFELGFGPGGGGGAPAFSPSDIAGLLVWLDVSDILTVFQDDAHTTPVVSGGDPIGCLLDKGAGGRNFTQSTAAARLTYTQSVHNGMAGALSDGVDDYLQASGFPSLTARTVYLVVKDAGSADGANVLDAFASFLIYFAAAQNDYATPLDGYAGTAYFGSVATNANLLVMRTASAASSQLAVNGGAFGAPYDPFDSILTNTIHRLAAGPTATKAKTYYMSLMIYDTALSDADDARVRSYINTRWALY